MNDRETTPYEHDLDDVYEDMEDPSLEYEEDGEETDEHAQADNDYIHVVVPKEERDELEDDPESWSAWLPKVGLDGHLDWEEMVFIEGRYPNTTLSRQALNAVPKRLKGDPLLSMKEADENMLRMCITRIGTARVGWADLRGKGLDGHLHYKQQQMVSAYFAQLTQPTKDEIDAFLTTVASGKRKRRR